MKKIISVLIAVSLVLMLCVPAFAGASVDALTDAQEKEVATLILASIQAGNDPATVRGKATINSAVVNGITDYTPYQTAYNANNASIEVIVSNAVTAVRQDSNFAQGDATQLVSDITASITEKVLAMPTTGGSGGSGDGGSGDGGSGGITLPTDMNALYVTLLTTMGIEQKQSTLVSLVGNNVLSVEDAEAIIDTLYTNGSISADEQEQLLEAITSDEASTNFIDGVFEGYTPTDLAQLFRGFGDSIGGMTEAIANLFRSTSGGSDDPTEDPTTNGSSQEPVPPTGDYAIPAVAAIAVVAGLALILTKKKES